jgi:hypothetical protein
LLNKFTVKEGDGIACSSIDISGQGSKDNVTQEQWYTGIVFKIVKDLGIAKPLEFRRTWWRDRNDIYRCKS